MKRWIYTFIICLLVRFPLPWVGFFPSSESTLEWGCACWQTCKVSFLASRAAGPTVMPTRWATFRPSKLDFVSVYWTQKRACAGYAHCNSKQRTHAECNTRSTVSTSDNESFHFSWIWLNSWTQIGGWEWNAWDDINIISICSFHRFERVQCSHPSTNSQLQFTSLQFLKRPTNGSRHMMPILCRLRCSHDG